MKTKTTKQEWLSNKKCHKCGHRLRMVEYGDWGICTNKECLMVWNMFQKHKTVIGGNDE